VPLGTGSPQRALTPQWGFVAPFGITSRYGRDIPGPPRLPGGELSPEDIVTAVGDTADLDDPSKIKAEYWADGPRSEFPPGHWAVSARSLGGVRPGPLPPAPPQPGRRRPADRH